MSDPLTPAEIQAIRAAHGYTQSEMAAACGVALRTVQDWLSGRRNPSGPAVLVLRRLAADAERPQRMSFRRESV